MATNRHATNINQKFIYVVISLALPMVGEGATKIYEGYMNDNGGRRLTREYHLRQGALRGLIVRPSRNYDLQNVEIFLGIPYAAAPTGNLRFMPPVSAPPWPGVRMATHFAPVCPQSLPTIQKGNPPSMGRQNYLSKLKPFLANESEDCLYLNIYVPYREQKSKKFPVLVFIHGDSFEWSSGNPYDGRILAAYGNIMVITINFRLGILGFMKPSLTEHDYGNNGLLDQLAALQWIKDNIEDLNGDPSSVTLMGHGTGAACVNYLMLSPISNGLFHRAILMSGSALSDWAMTKDPTQYTLQVAQSLGCNPASRNMMGCLQRKPLSDIKKVQIEARKFETPLGPTVAGSFIPNEPAKTMDAFPNLLSNSSDENSRRRRATYNQLETLWEFLNSHKEIATGFNKSAQAREHSRRMWESVAEALNSQGDCAVKGWKGWSSPSSDSVPSLVIESIGIEEPLPIQVEQIPPYQLSQEGPPEVVQPQPNPTTTQNVVDSPEPQPAERRRRRRRTETSMSQEAARRTLVELSRERLQLEVRNAHTWEQVLSTLERIATTLDRYQLLSGVTELESYHDFSVIELDHGVLETQRDAFIKNYAKLIFDTAEGEALESILKKYAPSRLDPQRWSVEANRDVVLDLFSDARALAPCLRFADYQSKANRQSYFYVFGHNSVSSEFAALNKSVHGEELPYILGVPLGGANTHFVTDYTLQEKLLSEVMMRLWTNFVKIGSPNTQSVNKYFTLDHKQWNHYNVEWPEYDDVNQPYLRLDIPPSISSLYRSNFTSFWIDELPAKMSRYAVDPLFEYTPTTSPKPKPTNRNLDPIRKIWSPQLAPPPHYSSPTFGKVRPYSRPARPDTDVIYRQIQSIKTPSRPVPPGSMEQATTQAPTAKLKPNIPVKTSSATVTLIISLGVLFLVFDVAICSILYFKKRKLRLREQTLQSSRQSRAEIGEVDLIGQKSKEDKGALQTLKNSCSVIKSMSFNKKRGSVKKIKKKSDTCKTPKSDDSGGFRERFQLRRHLSTSTLDAHTKVRDWIANEVMHRCSPAILRKSNLDLNNDKHLSVVKPFTRSEELLSDSRRAHIDNLKINEVVSMNASKAKTSEKTTSTSALGSHSSITSNKHSLHSIKKASKSSDSLKSKATDSIKSKKVSVAIDATPSARTRSILQQEPIEISKSFDNTNAEHSSKDNQLQRSETEGEIKIDNDKLKKDDAIQTFLNEVTLSVSRENPLIISHKHSRSDPVTDVNYEMLIKEKMESGVPVIDILPPVTFRNDINVTSRDDKSLNAPLTPEEALLTIRRMNFPKVLPDLPRAQKRLSLQPTSLQTFRSYSSSIESQSERSRVPPQPPPRTTTLERRLAYKNTKPLSSFDASNVKKIPEVNTQQDYENINTLSPDPPVWNKSFEKSILPSTRPDPIIIVASKEREIPKVIIASSDTTDSAILITPASSQREIPLNVPRVRLPDDFHCERTDSVTSFSSFYSDDNEDDDDVIFDDLLEDKLIQELVGGVDSPTNMGDELDSKGPDSMYEKKLEIVPVKIKTTNVPSKNNEDYVCVSDLHLPDMSGVEPTAQIKSNFSLNKLQHRSDSINRPPEKAIKVKHKKSIKPSILNRSMKAKSSGCSKSDSKLEHSTSGSSNDTETSTGTVKRVEVKNDN